MERKQVQRFWLLFPRTLSAMYLLSGVVQIVLAIMSLLNAFNSSEPVNLTVFSIVLLCIGSFMLSLGIGFWKLQKWALYSALFVHSLILLGQIIELFELLQSGRFSTISNLSVSWAVLHVLLILVLIIPQVRKKFI